MIADEQPDRPVVISVNIEGDADRAASVARSLGIDYPTLIDTGSRWGACTTSRTCR